jgi:2-polyprenyl-3-methyl-5-hydroxy-6-metoxy-1,4-benzoquinol methylase
MKNASLWRPTRLLLNSKTNSFEVNKAVVYAGSYHIAQLQLDSYLPLMQQYCRGQLLDCGCGAVPYYEVYKNEITNAYCIDWSEQQQVAELLDEQIDLNKAFQLKQNNFDTVLATDVIAHVTKPGELIDTLGQHMQQGAHLILTTPFVYWISEFPHEYFHPTAAALSMMCEEAGMQVIHLAPYGGHADVLLDTLNKSMTGKWSNRLFRMLASVVKKTGWYKKTNQKTRYSYPLGYTLVAQKI